MPPPPSPEETPGLGFIPFLITLVMLFNQIKGMSFPSLKAVHTHCKQNKAGNAGKLTEVCQCARRIKHMHVLERGHVSRSAL